MDFFFVIILVSSNERHYQGPKGLNPEHQYMHRHGHHLSQSLLLLVCMQSLIMLLMVPLQGLYSHSWPWQRAL